MLELMVQSSGINKKPKTGIFMRIGTMKEPVTEVTLSKGKEVSRPYIRATKKLLVEHLMHTDILEFGDFKFSMNPKVLKHGARGLV
jgi:hypothetical protein